MYFTIKVNTQTHKDKEDYRHLCFAQISHIDKKKTRNFNPGRRRS